MRLLTAALGALLLFAFVGTTAQARERRSGLIVGSNIFGAFNRSDRARIKRLRQRRAKARKSRTASRRNVRRVASRTRRKAVRKRSATRRSTVRRKARRSKKVRRVARRSTSRKVVSRAKKRRTNSRKFARQTVPYRSKQRPGTIVVDTKTRHLYYVLKGGKAIRYGVAVGKEGFAWSGTSRIRRKVKWPTWTPPAEMIERKPELAEFRDGMPGGPQNPLGARALYLYKGKQDTLYRIHGTNNPASIGRAASSGCIRMRNEDVEHLYARVGMGAKVIVR